MSLKWPKKWNKDWTKSFVSRGDNIAPRLFGLQAWYDLTNSAYLTLASTAITQALDRSGNGNHTAVQGTGTARPTFTSNQINGLPAAVFDGGDQLMLPAALYSIPNGANTVFIVSKQASVTGTLIRPLEMNASGSGRWNVSYAVAANTIGFSSGGSAVNASPFTVTNFNIITGRRSGTTIGVSVNNSAETTNSNGANAADVNSGSIGGLAGGQLTGVVCEVLIYNRSLSAAEITQVNRYLANKYAITIS